MGLFDSLKKLGQDLEKEIENGVGKDAIQNIKDAVANAGAGTATNSFSHNSNTGGSGKTIPTEYSEFPVFEGKLENVSTKETNNYTRCSMDYYNVTDEQVHNYILKINSLGYTMGSKVRYDKGNTYIIVDNQYGDLNIVYHVKK